MLNKQKFRPFENFPRYGNDQFYVEILIVSFEKKSNI